MMGNHNIKFFVDGVMQFQYNLNNYCDAMDQLKTCIAKAKNIQRHVRITYNGKNHYDSNQNIQTT